MLLHLTAVLALAVAVLYGFIGLYVVPKLARIADRTSGLLRAAQYGAAAFFVGCAMTHIALAEHMLAVPELIKGHEWAHLAPHILQVFGGATFALIAWRKLDVRLQTKDEARYEAESERLREQLERSQRLNGLGQLAGGVAHDFNNLLAVIGGYARMLDKRLADNPELRLQAGEIVAAADRGAELTRQMLVFSRGTAPEIQTSDLNRAIEGSETLLRRAAGELVELRLILARDAPAVGLGRGRIEQILLNLTLNARDAMPDGGKLTIRTDVDDDVVRLTVLDTGEGMPEEVKAHAFDPFFTTKAEGEGTGLGLSVVYGIVERAGGNIDLDSSPGMGTCFAIDLPRAHGAAAEAPKTNGTAGSLRGVTVLVVDDQEAVRELTVKILQQHDAHVVGAANGEEALTLLAQHEEAIDVVVTDIVMPGMSGTELARRLRGERPGLPLVYFSGHIGDVDRPDDGPLVEKPFTPEALVSAIGDVLPARLLN
ncbi:hybrid sensor histidine kinase/response regulator [Solirubrobacter soli]|uniref:hybrid sensor histidine kinase/response regulator n=1 Tax=Solirubrobacter soli TaxID=363832 RepID=UPI00040982EB|nr:ATP-binding protein [Solirubrobacter soli]